MEKKNFIACDVKVVKIDLADIIAGSPSFECPTDGDPLCMSDGEPGGTEDFG